MNTTLHSSLSLKILSKIAIHLTKLQKLLHLLHSCIFPIWGCLHLEIKVFVLLYVLLRLCFYLIQMKMKLFGPSFSLSLLVVTITTALFVLLVASSSSPADVTLSDNVNGMTPTTSIKRPKEESYNTRSLHGKTHADNNVHLDDYHLIDPPPCSKANISSAPIEHGSPFIPHIPEPKPPNPANQDASIPSPA